MKYNPYNIQCSSLHMKGRTDDPPRTFHSFWAESVVGGVKMGDPREKKIDHSQAEPGLPREKTIDHSQAEPGLSHWCLSHSSEMMSDLEPKRWASLTTWQRGPHTVVWPLSDWSGWILIKPAAKQHWLNHLCRRTDKNWQKISFNYHQIPSYLFFCSCPGIS